MSYEWEDRLWITGIIVVVSGLIAFAVFADIQDQHHWDAFSAQHHCRMVAHISGSSALTTGISSSGKLVTGSTYIPGKDGFLCDDGITYYRDN